MHRFLFSALLLAGTTLAHAAPSPGLPEARAQDEQCLLGHAYDGAKELAQRHARIDSALSACIRLERGALAWLARQHAVRNGGLREDSPRAQELLERSRQASRRWLGLALDYCRGEPAAATCHARLERIPGHH